MIDRAAKARGKSRADFIIDASVRAAEDTLLDQTLVTVDPETYRHFLAVLTNRRRRLRTTDERARALAAEMTAVPALLDEAHNLSRFDSGHDVLDEWLRRQARANQVSGASRTYVICDGRTVIGYYCLASGALGASEAPGGIRRNMPDPMPMAVLGRLAIDRASQGKGPGEALYGTRFCAPPGRAYRRHSQIAGARHDRVRSVV